MSKENSLCVKRRKETAKKYLNGKHKTGLQGQCQPFINVNRLKLPYYKLKTIKIKQEKKSNYTFLRNIPKIKLPSKVKKNRWVRIHEIKTKKKERRGQWEDKDNPSNFVQSRSQCLKKY